MLVFEHSCLLLPSKVYTHVSAGEVTTLKHEAGDDAVEARVLVAEALLAGAEGTEVLGCVGDVVIEEVHDDAALVSWMTLAFLIQLIGPRLMDGIDVCPWYLRGDSSWPDCCC